MLSALTALWYSNTAIQSLLWQREFIIEWANNVTPSQECEYHFQFVQNRNALKETFCKRILMHEKYSNTVLLNTWKVKFALEVTSRTNKGIFSLAISLGSTIAVQSSRKPNKNVGPNNKSRLRLWRVSEAYLHVHLETCQYRDPSRACSPVRFATFLFVRWDLRSDLWQNRKVTKLHSQRDMACKSCVLALRPTFSSPEPLGHLSHRRLRGPSGSGDENVSPLNVNFFGPFLTDERKPGNEIIFTLCIHF